MSDVRGSGDADFFRELFRDLVAFLRCRGWGRWDAEDAAQTALMELFARWDSVLDPCAYARSVASRVISHMKRQREELSTRPAEPATSDPDLPEDVDLIVRDCLAILWRRPTQQKVMALALKGYRSVEIADELGLRPATTRSHKRHARLKVKPILDDDGHEVRRLEVLHATYEAFLRGDRLPVAPRPVIGEAWLKAMALGLDPERGAAVELLGQDELVHRRELSPLATDCSWVLSTLDDLAMETGTMWVLADQDGVVLC